MHLNDVAFGIIKEDLIPFLGKSGSIIGKGNALVVKMRLERLYIIGAKGDMAALYRVDMPAVSDRHIEITLGKMHLHIAVGGKSDLAVIAGFIVGIGARKILWGDGVHPQNIDIKILQGVDVLRDLIDMMKFQLHGATPNWRMACGLWHVMHGLPQRLIRKHA